MNIKKIILIFLSIISTNSYSEKIIVLINNCGKSLELKARIKNSYEWKSQEFNTGITLDLDLFDVLYLRCLPHENYSQVIEEGLSIKIEGLQENYNNNIASYFIELKFDRIIEERDTEYGKEHIGMTVRKLRIFTEDKGQLILSRIWP